VAGVKIESDDEKLAGGVEVKGGTPWFCRFSDFSGLFIIRLTCLGFGAGTVRGGSYLLWTSQSTRIATKLWFDAFGLDTRFDLFDAFEW
jgi:hypothetical protein